MCTVLIKKLCLILSLEPLMGSSQISIPPTSYDLVLYFYSVGTYTHITHKDTRKIQNKLHI